MRWLTPRFSPSPQLFFSPSTVHTLSLQVLCSNSVYYSSSSSSSSFPSTYFLHLQSENGANLANGALPVRRPETPASRVPTEEDHAGWAEQENWNPLLEAGHPWSSGTCQETNHSEAGAQLQEGGHLHSGRPDHCQLWWQDRGAVRGVDSSVRAGTHDHRGKCLLRRGRQERTMGAHLLRVRRSHPHPRQYLLQIHYYTKGKVLTSSEFETSTSDVSELREDASFLQGRRLRLTLRLVLPICSPDGPVCTNWTSCSTLDIPR